MNRICRALGLMIVLAGTLVPSAAAALQSIDEPEEPDFFFLTGGPYTQKQNSPQIIWASQRFRTTMGAFEGTGYVGGGRFEWGLTDRWEVDLEFGVLGARETVAGVRLQDVNGAADLMFGVRYRLLDESGAPFTLTLGPQVIAPVASRARGLGNGETGYAVDVTAARDWGGPVFVAASVNAAVFPDVAAFPDGTGGRANLNEVGWSAALGWRALERPGGDGTSHDLHGFLEWAGERVESFNLGLRERVTAWQFSPGLRYGFVSRGGSLTEIGIGFPIGLDDDAPDWGFIIQFQFELASLGGN